MSNMIVPKTAKPPKRSTLTKRCNRIRLKPATTPTIVAKTKSPVIFPTIKNKAPNPRSA